MLGWTTSIIFDTHVYFLIQKNINILFMAFYINLITNIYKDQHLQTLLDEYHLDTLVLDSIWSSFMS